MSVKSVDFGASFDITLDAIRFFFNLIVQFLREMSEFQHIPTQHTVALGVNEVLMLGCLDFFKVLNFCLNHFALRVV